LLQDFDGEPRDANSGRDYFKKRFARLAQKAGRSKEREIYIQSVPRFVTDRFLLRLGQHYHCNRYGVIAGSYGGG
jgi:guanine nucleotide-binding protein subunit alpha